MGGSNGGSDHTTVGVEITSSPSNRAVEASLIGTDTVKVNGSTPFSTEVRVPNECKGFDPNRIVQAGCAILGIATFVPLVNDPSNGTLKLCLSAFYQRNWSQSTILVTVTVKPMTPPTWLDAHGCRRPTLACWTCGREVAPMRFRAEDLRPHGWQPGRTLQMPDWCV